jgi:ABC-type antimicrobial peptide transport system permease subunit
MFKNYIKIAFRNIYKQRLYYLIQIFGFGLSLSCVILILSWIQYEKSFDTFHEKGNRIYRILMTINADSENSFDLAITPPPLVEAIQAEFPEVEKAARLEFCPKVVFEYETQIHYESHGIMADPAFLEMFSFPFLKGEPGSALDDINSIVLTQSTAEKYFPDSDPINKTMTIEGISFKVTGLIEEIPPNSHLKFDFILPFKVKTLFGADLSDWGNVNIYSYILLKENTEWANFYQKFLIWETPRNNDAYYLQSLAQIHKESGIQADEVIVSDAKYLNIFIILAFIILFIASINFINLQSAQVLQRKKEVGIRKVSGASKSELIKQLMIESIIVLLSSYLISFLMVELLLPFFKQLFTYEISLLFYDPVFLGILTVLFILIIFFTSTLPSLRFASFHPAGLIQDINLNGKRKTLSRTILVVLQFSFSVFFIVGTLVINQQFRFMKRSSLNNQQGKIIYLPFKGDIASRYHAFRNRLESHASIDQVTAKNSLPTKVANKTSELRWQGKNPDLDFIIESIGVDANYFETMGMEVINGNSFLDLTSSKELSPLIINETALKNMGISDPIGTRVSLWDYPGEIVGIVKDVQFMSLRNQNEGQVFYIIPDYRNQQVADFGVILVKIKGDIPSAISFIEDEWNEYNPATPFEYHFLDEAVDNLYWEEMRLSRLMNYTSFFSIFICCLGLLGLVINSSNDRIKEIGIRKINGASLSNIVALLNRDHMKWVFLSFILAFPIAWIFLNKWLQNFAYQINISWWVFLLAGILTLTIALLTVNWQIFKVARKNPVDVLRYE